MYWWNVSKLAEDFREGRVEEKERFKYFLATSMVWFLVAQPFLYYGQTFEIVDLISAAVGLTITIAGTILCYRANASGDNADFIGRMICLSWPIGIKFLTIGGVLFLLFQILLYLVFGSDFALRVGGEISGGLLLLFYYWLIYKYVTLVARGKESENPA